MRASAETLCRFLFFGACKPDQMQLCAFMSLSTNLMGPRGASLAIFVSLAGAPQSIVVVGFDDAGRGQYY